jgi:hypothetical protein
MNVAERAFVEDACTPRSSVWEHGEVSILQCSDSW